MHFNVMVTPPRRVRRENECRFVENRLIVLHVRPRNVLKHFNAPCHVICLVWPVRPQREIVGDNLVFWKVRLCNRIVGTFKTQPAPCMIPLYSGGLTHNTARGESFVRTTLNPSATHVARA